jgi:hypothetical protein
MPLAARTRTIASLRKGFDELSASMEQLHRCLLSRERTRHKLEKAARALVSASATADLAISRRLLSEALEAARAGLEEMDGTERQASEVRELQPAAD